MKKELSGRDMGWEREEEQAEGRKEGAFQWLVSLKSLINSFSDSFSNGSQVWRLWEDI